MSSFEQLALFLGPIGIIIGLGIVAFIVLCMSPKNG